MTSEPVDRVTDMTSLLGGLDCRSVRDVKVLVDSFVDCGICQVRRTSTGLEVQLDQRGILFDFPFSLQEFWTAIEELESEVAVSGVCSSLEEEICDVEGFVVEVHVDESGCEPDWTTLHRSIPDRYAFASAAPDEWTVEEWLSARVRPHLKQLAVEVPGATSNTSTLREIRRRSTDHD